MYSFLKSVDIQFDFNAAISYGQIGGYINIYTNDNQPVLDSADIVIIGVEEDRNAIDNKGTAYAPNVIRKAFYNLYPGQWHLKIVDIGNLILTDAIEVTYQNLVKVLQFLPKDIHLIILGGSQDLSLALTNFLDLSNKPYNFSVIDAFIDSAFIDREIDSENYLTYILGNSGSLLQNLSLLGIQTYYSHPSKFKIFDKLHVDYFKLGEVQNQINEVEPELREADFVSIDLRSVRSSDMPAHKIGQPNGFTGVEICKLSRMAGIASKNKMLGLFEYNPMYDFKENGAQLAAQVIWYYIEGKNVYQDDYPKIPKEQLIKFYVENEVLKLVFYKNPETNRWWVEIPKAVQQPVLFPCSEIDYQAALKLKITPRIYRIINKITI